MNQNYGSLVTINETNETYSCDSVDKSSENLFCLPSTDQSGHRVRVDVTLAYYPTSRTISGCITSGDGFWEYVQDTQACPPNEISFHIKLTGSDCKTKTKWRHSNVKGVLLRFSLRCDCGVEKARELRVRLYGRGRAWRRARCYGQCLIGLDEVVAKKGDVDVEEYLTMCQLSDVAYL